MSEPLKPCQLCEGKAKYVWSKVNSRYLVHAECLACGCVGPVMANALSAAKAWEVFKPRKPKPKRTHGNKELKRCPFCGGKAEIRGGKNKGKAFYTDWFIMCTECLVSGNNYSTEQKAKDAWNRRINDD